MSVALPLHGLSNPGLKPWVITVVVIIVITWRLAADVVSALADVLGLTTAVYAGHDVQQRTTATTLAGNNRGWPSQPS
jgi:hypothetical protein